MIQTACPGGGWGRAPLLLIPDRSAILCLPSERGETR